jgi:hypothetical protein
VPEATTEERAYLAQLLERLDEGDQSAFDELETLALTNVRDAALANLVYRLQHIEPGGSYDLG